MYKIKYTASTGIISYKKILLTLLLLEAVYPYLEAL